MLTDFLRGKIVTRNFLKPAAAQVETSNGKKMGIRFIFGKRLSNFRNVNQNQKQQQNRRVVSERRGAKVSEFISS